MAISWDTQLFEDLKLVIGQYNTARAAAAAAFTAKQTFEVTVIETSGYTEEHKAMLEEGSAAFDTAIAGHVATMDACRAFALSSWVRFAARNLEDDGDIIVPQVTFEDVMQTIISQMITDDEDVDASTPSIGAVSYATEMNQGDGTATVAINSSTTILAELAMPGRMVLECYSAGFSVQNAERWRMGIVFTDPRTNQNRTIYSPTEIKTSEEFEDVSTSVAGVYDDPRLQRPLTSLSQLHSGLIGTINPPNYNTDIVESAGDTASAWSGYSQMAKVGTKGNCSRRNVTFAGTDGSNNGTIYLACVYVAGAPDQFDCTWYQDSAKTIALSDTQSIAAGDGDSTITWLAVTTNPEHVNNGGHLRSTDAFMQALVDESQLHTLNASFDVTITVPLPWAVGDRIYATITNSGAGTISRFFTEELGVALRTIADTSETISDP